MMSGSKPDNENGGYADSVRRVCEEFLQVTALKSLQFVKYSTHWAERIFWSVLMVGGTVMAIRDVRRVCENYMHEETDTRMSVVSLAELAFKDAIICVAYDALDLSLSDPHLLRHANTSEMVDLAAKANTSATELLSRGLKLFTAISLIESARTTDSEERVADILNDDPYLFELQAWLQVQKVDIFRFGSTVGNWLCQAARISIKTMTRGTLRSSVNPCQREKITWLGVVPFDDSSTALTSFCLDIGGLIVFESMTRVVVTINSNDLFRNGSPSNRTGGYTLNSYLDFSGDPVSTAIAKYYLQFPYKGCLNYEIGINAEMRLLDRRTARCNTTTTSRLACFAGCEVLLYEMTDRCSCTHLAWRFLFDHNKPMCFDSRSIEEHLACRHEARRQNFSELCFKACLFPCTHRQYGITNVEACNVESYRAGASLELTPKGLAVPVFIEQLSPTLSEVFSHIGGTCGLWLGVGIIGICHALLLPLKIVACLIQHRVGTKVANAPLTVDFMAIEHL